MTTLITEPEVLKMAVQAGYHSGIAMHDIELLEAFAKLVASEAIAKEREACAKVCDAINAVYNNPEDTAERVASQWCAERIRARRDEVTYGEPTSRGDEA
jgi:hypothetical protein